MSCWVRHSSTLTLPPFTPCLLSVAMGSSAPPIPRRAPLSPGAPSSVRPSSFYPLGGKSLLYSPISLTSSRLEIPPPAGQIAPPDLLTPSAAWPVLSSSHPPSGQLLLSTGQDHPSFTKPRASSLLGSSPHSSGPSTPQLQNLVPLGSLKWRL